jgi:multidrug efflux pump subunit AcrB
MSTLLYRHHRALTLVLIIILAGGISSLLTIPREEDPTITNRIVVIITPFPGADAERVESLVTERIEDELREISEIETIRSNSRNGISVITVEMQDRLTDMTGPFSLLRDALTDARSRFPDGVGAPIIDEDRGYAFTLIAAVSWDGPGPANLAILKRLGEELQHRLRNLPGTEYVKLFGAPTEEITLRVDESVLSSLGLTPTGIAQAIAGADAKVSAGVLRNAAQDLPLEVGGELNTLARIRAIPISRDPGGTLLRVGDIATVARGVVDPPQDLAFVADRAAVVVAARMESGRRVDRWAARARELLQGFAMETSGGIRMDTVFDQSAYTDERLGVLIGNLLLGAALVIAVLLVSLGARAALIVAAAIPLTGLVSLTALNLMGIPIHQMSVTGLIVALGLLVDAAIVMVHAIQHRLHTGAPALDAVKEAVARLWIPLLSSTVTTVLAFLPIALLPGSVGEFVSPIAISVIIALGASLLLALTVIPALAGRFLVPKTPAAGPRSSGGIWSSGIHWPAAGRALARALDLALRRPRLSLLGASALPALGFLGFGTLTSQFFPEADRNQFHVQLRLPPQTAIVETARVVRRAYALMIAHGEIESVHWYVGRSAPSFFYNLSMDQDGLPGFAEAQVTTTSIAAVQRVVPRLQAELDAAFPQAQILVRKVKQGPPTYAPVEIRIYGASLDALRALGDEVRQVLSRIPGITHTHALLSGGQPKLGFDADEAETTLGGLRLAELAQAMAARLEGALGGSVVERNEELAVRVRVDDRQRAGLAEIASLSITSPGAGETDRFGGIPLSALGVFRLIPTEDVIPRRDGERLNLVAGYVGPATLPATALGAFQALWAQEGHVMPAGYRLEFGGDAEARSDAIGDLLSPLGLIVTLTLATVVLSFNSFSLAGIVFLAAIQAMGLGLLSLALFDFPFGFGPIMACWAPSGWPSTRPLSSCPPCATIPAPGPATPWPSETGSCARPATSSPPPSRPLAASCP